MVTVNGEMKDIRRSNRPVVYSTSDFLYTSTGMKFLWLIKHNAVTAYEGMEVWLHALLTLALEGEWFASLLGRLSPGKWPPTTVPTEYDARWGLEPVFNDLEKYFYSSAESRTTIAWYNLS